jgi:cytochrome bd ubiquinol oxidase subunit II
MPELWFWLVAITLAGYVILDGFDLGVGILHLFIAKTDDERHAVLKSIGPVWDGNEVWLLAAGGSLFSAFPALYASAISGFYLPIALVMWLLVFRALGIEMRHQLSHPLWNQAWDVAFSVSSALLAIAFGAALGAIVRGVTFLDGKRFFAPLWTTFLPTEPAGILDVYTVSVAITAAVVLAWHGSLWIAHRVEGPPRTRAVALTKPLSIASAALCLGVTALTFLIRPSLANALAERPWGYAFPLVAALAFLSAMILTKREHYVRAFIASSVFVGAMVCNAANSVYPFVLISTDGVSGMAIREVASHPETLSTALFWWIPGMTLAVFYAIWIYRRLPLARQ